MLCCSLGYSILQFLSILSSLIQYLTFKISLKEVKLYQLTGHLQFLQTVPISNLCTVQESNLRNSLVESASGNLLASWAPQVCFGKFITVHEMNFKHLRYLQYKIVVTFSSKHFQPSPKFHTGILKFCLAQLHVLYCQTYLKYTVVTHFSMPADAQCLHPRE